MKYTILVAALVGISAVAAVPPLLAPAQKASPPPAAPANDNYEPGPDSKPQPDVPRGKSFQFKFEGSRIFPGTSRVISVFVPAQYTGERPACVYVGLDGLGFNAPTVFENLIHKKEMPVTIAVGISPGQVESADGKANPRFNRSNEFDALNDSLARCVLEEILPEVEEHQTPDGGLPIKLSQDGNDRCTGGGSTGGIGAFTLAWERPDAFRRVFSAIGTYVGMRGGDHYPVLVRKTEPKTIRIFMQDGSNDEWMGGPEVGDWWMGNQTLQRALEFAGYDHEHVWGTGPHSGRHATAIFPDAMRFLWKDWPQPVKAGESHNTFLKAILEADESWSVAAEGYESAGALASNPSGDVFFRDLVKEKAYKVGADGKAEQTSDVDGKGRSLAFGADGKPAEFSAEGITVTSAGNMYATEAAGNVWLVKPGGEKVELDTGLNHPAGIALSPDGEWLSVLENNTHWGYSYKVMPDGKVQDKQRFYWLHVPDWADDSGAGQICHDRDGRLYAATRMGVQVLDRNGRVRAILPLPGDGQVTGVCFGGAKFDTLFAAAGGKVYRRKLKVPGATAWSPPIKLPPWGAG